jgi:hypothetical protein
VHYCTAQVRISADTGGALRRYARPVNKEVVMAVLITADVPGQTQEKYDRMLAVLEPLIRQAKGFIAHGAGPAGDGWRSFEVWETAEDATHFFATCIHPTLPPGITPKRTLLQLHSLVQAE